VGSRARSEYVDGLLERGLTRAAHAVCLRGRGLGRTSGQLNGSRAEPTRIVKQGRFHCVPALHAVGRREGQLCALRRRELPGLRREEAHRAETPSQGEGRDAWLEHGGGRGSSRVRLPRSRGLVAVTMTICEGGGEGRNRDRSRSAACSSTTWASSEASSIAERGRELLRGVTSTTRMSSEASSIAERGA